MLCSTNTLIIILTCMETISTSHLYTGQKEMYKHKVKEQARISMHLLNHKFMLLQIDLQVQLYKFTLCVVR